ncbi:MAG: DNA cytosine methyltransferase [Putridiphycobacter sp.]
MKKGITYLDLFAGLGAFPKGLLDAGFKFSNHYFSEIDKYAIANYSYNFKHAKNLGDVTKIKTKKIKRPDIITFGSPCQDISHAGLKAGIQGSRSKLFYDAIGIIDRLRPKVFVFENVKGLFFSNKGKDFEVVLKEIANLGVYDCQWQLINTAWFLPQNRERIFLVGSLRGFRIPQIFPLLKGYSKNQKRKALVKIVGRINKGQSGRVYSAKGFSPTLTVGHGYGNGIVKVGNRFRKLTPTECERLQGLPDHWTKYGKYENRLVEIREVQRYKLLGNAITSLVMKRIAQKLKPAFDKGLNGVQLPNPLELKALELFNELLNI